MQNKILNTMTTTTKKIKAIYYKDIKYYTIHVASGRFYARRITKFAEWFGEDKYQDLGNTKGFEDAMILVKLDAASLGDVIRYEIDG